jgi:lactoylglutathione lyase
MAPVSYRTPFPILYTEDLPRALAFYRDRLGFEQAYQFPPDGEAVFVGLAEPVDQPWGERMAYVADPDGNPVMICAPLEPPAA